MKKPIITIERQYGSGGSKIGRLVAEKLSIPFYNREIIEMTAKKSGLPVGTIENAEENVPTSFLYSLLLVSNAATSFEQNLPLSDRIFIMESDIIKEIAESQEKFVLVGRCGSYILEDKGCFSVFIYSEKQKRIERITSDYDVESKKAESTLKKIDKRREVFYNTNVGKPWQDKEQYNICLNSGLLGDELCAELIIKAYLEYNNSK